MTARAMFLVAMAWLPEDEFVGPDHPDWAEATPLELIDPTTIGELKRSPSRPSSPNTWIIDKMLSKDSDEGAGSPSKAMKVRFDLAAEF